MHFQFNKKKAVRMISFARFDEHSNPLFLSFFKTFELVTEHIAIFMYKFCNRLLPFKSRVATLFQALD